HTPVFRSSRPTIHIYHMLFEYLTEKLAPATTVHGTLVDVYGVGVLFTGRSGIGKSEIALDLVERGHRLVADDIVCIIKKRSGMLTGTSQKLLKNMLEIRGVGLIDVWSTFGIRATRVQKRIEVEVLLEDHRKIEDYDRLGVEDENREYLGVKIPLLRLPIFPGKNITVISEVIALKVMQRIYGFRPEKDFINKLDKKIKEQNKIRKYLAGDIE
ncbi:HPr kinase/phosphorylase, partial [candidate division KSB1 bacterium]